MHTLICVHILLYIYINTPSYQHIFIRAYVSTLVYVIVYLSNIYSYAYCTSNYSMFFIENDSIFTLFAASTRINSQE